MTEPAVPTSVEVYDTTLRDGSQLEGISLTVEDKLRIAEQLDWLGVHYIEAGWPGANPKDDEFFRRAATELDLHTSELVAFGSTRRVKGKVDSDETLANLLAAGTGTVCIVGKSSDFHVTETLRADLDEGVAMVRDSVEYLKGQGRRVFFDAEHFFDGYKANPEYALRVMEAAATNGADVLVCCDTNGGSLPHEVQRIVTEAAELWPSARVAAHHRIGRLEIGEASIVIAAASAHRAAAFAACRYVIERVKQIVPIWKHEFFEGGEVWIEGATANPEDEAARLEAVRRACA